MSSDYELRPATPADGAFLRTLYVSARPDLALFQAWPAAERERMLQQQFELQRAHYERSFPDAMQEIIVVDGTAVGRVWMDWRKDEVRCLDVALLPECRSAGLGGRLLEDLKALAAERGLPFTLSVGHDNPAARRFYERHGFREIKDIGTHALLEWTPPEP